MIKHQKHIPVQHRDKFICVVPRNTEGDAVLNISTGSGVSFLANSESRVRNTRNSRHVPMTTLGCLVSSPNSSEDFSDLERNTILLKVDMDGFELQVLEGTKDSLKIVRSVAVKDLFNEILSGAERMICSISRSSDVHSQATVNSSLSSADALFIQCASYPWCEV